MSSPPGLTALALSAMLIAATPAPAQQGHATVDCRVEKGGRLTGCVLVSETPTGRGVGAFALRLVKNYRVPPDDRRIRKGRILVPMTFKMPG